MYYINKIIGFVVSPVGLAIIGGAGALICVRLKRPRVAKWLGWGTAAWLWLWMTPIMTWVVGAPLEREFFVDGRVPTVETFPEADAIILLGGGMGADTNHNSYAEMSSGADRVWQAARMMFGKYAPGIEVVCAPADFEQTMMAENMFSFKAVVPDVMAFQFNCFAFREWVGVVGYKLFR